MQDNCHFLVNINVTKAVPRYSPLGYGQKG